MITLPIYYTETFRTKPDKTHLVGLNWHRNIHFHLKNKVKQHFHDLVAAQTSTITPISGTFHLTIDIYYKNPSSDGSNIAALIEKFTLDALQEQHIISNDNVKFHLGTTWSIIDQDKLNPRAIITII